MKIDPKSRLSEIDPEVAWGAWSPTPEEPWDARRVRLLFRRGGFGVDPATLRRALESSPEACVSMLLGAAGTAAETRQQEIFEQESEGIASAVRAGGDIDRLSSWWLHRMLHSPRPLVEKMTLFWHGHFATGADKVKDSELMYEQNQFLRQHAMGDVRAMVHGISKDAAMLIYLDSESNRKAHPNENYARELMELFCLGEGNYTEADVQELARCFTGWEVRRKRFRFNPYQHDSGEKTVLGRGGLESGESAIDVVVSHDSMPTFLVSKLVKFLVMDEPQPTRAFLAPLAKTLVASEYAMEPVVRQILQSRLLLSGWSAGRKVRSPVEFALELLRTLDATTNLDRLAKRLRPLGQALFYPPNVKGWDGGRAWINSSTLIGRSNFVFDVLGDETTRYAGKTLDQWRQQNKLSDNTAWSEWLSDALLAVPLPESERRAWLADAAERTNTKPGAAPIVALSQNPRIHLS
ncbi:MAG: DUF1800 family protein [Pirellula sp.]